MSFWDEAYSNSSYIEQGDAYPAGWAEAAAAFRAGAARASLDLPYGERPRERFDLFRPAGSAKGLLVFVHGGYWMLFDKSSWSHLAAGALAHGWAVGMPSYTLCPDARIGDITQQIGRAVIAMADKIPGPLRLAGHSAGGHLVSRLSCSDGPLPLFLRDRLEKTLSISGLHDLRPLLRTEMNRTLHLDAAEAARESPALLTPLPDLSMTCWVGARERPEFRRQTALLANIWTGLGARMTEYHAADHHHFSVIEDLADPDSPMIADLLDHPRPA